MHKNNINNITISKLKAHDEEDEDENLTSDDQKLLEVLGHIIYIYPYILHIKYIIYIIY